MNGTASGSCQCGAVTFEITGDFQGFFLCHCKRCRKDTGSAHAANLFASAARLTWLSGDDNIATYTVPETRHAKSFCKTCGAALPRLQADGSLIVPAGSLDTPAPMPPDAHIFMADRADWDEDLGAITRFDHLPQA